MKNPATGPALAQIACEIPAINRDSPASDEHRHKISSCPTPLSDKHRYTVRVQWSTIFPRCREAHPASLYILGKTP